MTQALQLLASLFSSATIILHAESVSHARVYTWQVYTVVVTAPLSWKQVRTILQVAQNAL